MKKKRKKTQEKFNPSICYKALKTHLDHFLSKNPRATFLPKKSCESILRLYANVTSCKKIRKAESIHWFFTKLERPHFGSKSSKFDVLTLANTWKTSFWAHFVPLLTQKPQKKNIVLKKTLLVNFKFIYYAKTRMFLIVNFS